jgi:hypothetical protein
MNNILLGLFFLILGLLLANMLTNICGCKIIEGQCDAESDGDCVWNLTECPVDGSIVYDENIVLPEQHATFLNYFCRGGGSAQQFAVGGTHISPNLFPGQGDRTTSTITHWKDSRCCIQLDTRDPCFPNPCENGGVCSLGFPIAEPLCECAAGYTGEHCEKTVSVDAAHVADVSTGSPDAAPLAPADAADKVSKSNSSPKSNTSPKDRSAVPSNSNDCNFKSGSRWTLTAIKDEMLAFNNGLKCLFNHSLPYKLGAADHNIVAIFE